MSTSLDAFLSVGILLATWGVIVPFAFALHGRKRAVKGTQHWHRRNLIVVTLRPLVKPAAVAWTAFSVLDDALGEWRWYTLLLIGLWLLIGNVWIRAADDGKDDDEGGPWNAIRKAIARLSPGRLVPARSGA